MDTELGMTWAGAGLYWGTTPRSFRNSLQGQTEKTRFFGFLSITNPFVVQVIITNDCC